MNFELANKGRKDFFAFQAKSVEEAGAFADKQLQDWKVEMSGSVLHCLDDGAVRIRTQDGWVTPAKVNKR